MDIKVEAVEEAEEQLEPLLYDDGSGVEAEINYKEYHQSDREIKTVMGLEDEEVSASEVIKGANVRVSPEQRIIMLHFMEEHPELAQNKLSGPQGAAARQRLWAKLAHSLNANFTGPSKPVEKWIKSWQDWKSDTKAKRLRLRKHAGGPTVGTPLPPLTELEERLLNIMGQSTSVGVEAVKDPLQCQMNCATQASSSSSPLLTNPQGVTEISFVSPEDCSGTPSPSSPILTPIFPTTACSASNSPIPHTTQTPSSSNPLNSQPSALSEGSERRGKKRKRGENDDDRNPSLEERLVVAAERRAAAIQQMADTFEEVAKKVADVFIEFLKRH